MKRDWWFIGIISCLVLLIVWGIYLIRNQDGVYIKDKEEQIKTLNSKIDSLELNKSILVLTLDSLYEAKNKVDSVIIKTKEFYEKDINDILTQSTSDDILFFTNYLSENDWGFSSSADESTTEAY